MSKPTESGKVWERTVNEDLLATWQRLRRRNDPDAIAKAVGVSRPVIDRALIHGFVTIPGLSEKITKFFEDRLDTEAQDSKRLNEKAEALK